MAIIFEWDTVRGERETHFMLVMMRYHQWTKNCLHENGSVVCYSQYMSFSRDTNPCIVHCDFSLRFFFFLFSTDFCE